MNLPNKITIFRMICIPFFVAAMEISFPQHYLIALIIFCVASYSDHLDGHIARSRHLITDFGKFMDPLADKLLTASAFICLVEAHQMMAWIVIVIIAREFAITGLRTLAASSGIVIAAGKLGKAKTVSQMITIILLILYSWQPQVQTLWLLGNILVYVALALTIISGIEYFVNNKNVIQSK
ncbi:MAG: CDP-diacylglycerol--glycerol-3-phosphate 3-phosphatidyltransferase [Pseudoramibacter sp.]